MLRLNLFSIPSARAYRWSAFPLFHRTSLNELRRHPVECQKKKPILVPGSLGGRTGLQYFHLSCRGPSGCAMMRFLSYLVSHLVSHLNHLVAQLLLPRGSFIAAPFVVPSPATCPGVSRAVLINWRNQAID